MKGEEKKPVIWMSLFKNLCVVVDDAGGHSHVPVHRLGHVWLVKLYLEILYSCTQTKIHCGPPEVECFVAVFVWETVGDYFFFKSKGSSRDFNSVEQVSLTCVNSDDTGTNGFSCF